VSKKWERRVVKVTVSPRGEPLHSERSTEIEIADDGAGEFIQIFQPDGDGKVSFDRDEWLKVRAAIDDMMATLRPLGSDA